MERQNKKAEGEKGVAIVIGELAKKGIQVAFPLSDNLPFDIILIYKGKLYKAQVKSGRRKHKNAQGSFSFKLTTNNWYSKTITKYTGDDIDVMVLCDYEKIFLLGPKDFSGRSSFNIRNEAPKNGQKKGINLAEDFVLCDKRIAEILA